MCNNETITVIVPIYNRAKYLDACLESIRKQTYENLEIILIDDGSTDDSPALCDAYAEKDRRIRVIHKENGGLSSARNAGIECASGQWLSFIDSDDSINLNFYSEMLKVALRDQCDIVQCEMERVSGQRLESALPAYEKKVFGSVEALTLFYGSKYTVFKSSCNKLFRRSIFQSVRYPVGRIFEDRWAANEIYYGAERVAYLTCPMYYYTINETGIMHSSASVKNYDTCLLYLEHYRFYQEKGEEYLASLAIRQFIISLLNVRYTFKRYSDIYMAEKEHLQKLYRDNAKKMWKSKHIPAMQKVVLSGVWHNIWLYFLTRDTLDVIVSMKKR